MGDQLAADRRGGFEREEQKREDKGVCLLSALVRWMVTHIECNCPKLS
jgi:hypothetical protein